jgi:NAD(P)-dependent dehydrogenase (short-subunit alcohol dehydrogenase family)
MAGRLEGKVAIITGASSGIGRVTALRFAREGARVSLADRNRPAGEETKRLVRQQGSDALFVPVDVSKADQVREMVDATVDRFGRLDILVNAAAILIRTPPLVEVDERDWDMVMDVNLKGLFFCCKYAIPAMLEYGGGSIVNIASQAGLRGYGISLPYALSKAGVIHLTTTAASQYTSQGIRINAIAPGSVDTPQLRGSTGSAEVVKVRQAEHPMGRIGRPEEISDLILFLASDEASFISGSTIVIDGGSAADAR